MKQTKTTTIDRSAKKLFMGFLIGGLLLSIIFLANFITQRREGRREGVGIVMAVHGNELTIVNRKNEQVTVIIQPNTKIKYLDTFQDHSLENKSVLVSGNRQENGVIKAEYINVLPDKRK